jgi:hypothetical protein
MSTSTTVSTERTIERLVKGVQTADGAGVKLTRVLTQDLQRRLDPFLMLDAFRNDNPDDYMGGFPDHPHRGFETVTYMIAGRMRHRDSAGNEGLLAPGGVQWMTAGSGLIHSELPEQEQGLMEGFQLWLNLPAARKMIKPSYRDIKPEHIPEFVTPEGVQVRVIAGTSHGVQGAVSKPDTEPLFLDIHLPAHTRFIQPIATGHRAFVYTYRGQATIGETSVPDRCMGILSNTGDRLDVSATEPTRVLLIAGKPLNEPIAQYGPFVMNTDEQIHQTLRDYRAGHFEAAVVQAL